MSNEVLKKAVAEYKKLKPLVKRFEEVEAMIKEALKDGIELDGVALKQYRKGAINYAKAIDNDALIGVLLTGGFDKDAVFTTAYKDVRQLDENVKQLLLDSNFLIQSPPVLGVVLTDD